MRYRNFSALLPALIIIVCLEAAAMASTSWYVVKDSDNEDIKYFKDDSGGYSPDSWAKAQSSSTLSGLLKDEDISDGDIIYLSGHTYLLDDTIALEKSVSIYGGFSGLEQTIDDRKNSSSPTILSGQDARQVLSITANANLDGLTITKGNNNHCGGIRIKAASPKITNCIITDNIANRNGAGIYVSGNSAPLITNCSITNNSADGNGGGFYIEISSTINIMNCSITNNSANSGGGIFATESNTVVNLSNSTVTGNSANISGGGILQQIQCTMNIMNCTIAINLNASEGLELCNNGGSFSLTNSIVWNENASVTSGTFSYTNCALTSSATGGTNTITLTEWDTPQSSEVTLNGVTHTVYAIADNPALKPLVAAGTSTGAPQTDQLGIARRLPPSIGAVEGAATYYVVKNGEDADENINYLKTSGEYDAQRWTEASVNGTLADFMKKSIDGDIVYIGAGTYTLAETLELGRSVKLLGGFALGDGRSSSILDGNASVNIMNIASDSQIDGLILKNAKDSALSISGSPVITNCEISGTNGRGVYVSSGSPSFTNCSVTGNSVGVLCEGEAAFMNCSIVSNTSNEFGSSSLTNSLVYGTSSGTGNFDHCALPEGFSAGNVTDSVYVASGWTPVSSSQTVGGVTHTVLTLTDNPVLNVLAGAGTSAGAPATDILGVTRLTPPTIGTLEYPYDTSYLLSIPESLSITGKGWNAVAGGISVKHDPANANRMFTPVKKLKISAASSNGWKLKSEHEQTIGYTLRAADGGTALTSLDFSPEEINAENGTAKTLGADVEDYSAKPAGEYADTLTFSVSIEDK